MDCCCSFSSFSLPFSLLVFVRCRRHPSSTPTPMDAARLTYIKTPHPHPPHTQKYCSRSDWTNDCLLHLLSTITFLFFFYSYRSLVRCVSACLPSHLSSVCPSVLRACSCLDAPWCATVVVVSYPPVSYSLCRVLHSKFRNSIVVFVRYIKLCYTSRVVGVCSPLRNKYISFVVSCFVFRASSFVSHLSSHILSCCSQFTVFRLLHRFRLMSSASPFPTRAHVCERDIKSKSTYIIVVCRTYFLSFFLFFSRFCDHYWR